MTRFSILELAYCQIQFALRNIVFLTHKKNFDNFALGRKLNTEYGTGIHIFATGLQLLKPQNSNSK